MNRREPEPEPEPKNLEIEHRFRHYFASGKIKLFEDGYCHSVLRRAGKQDLCRGSGGAYSNKVVNLSAGRNGKVVIAFWSTPSIPQDPVHELASARRDLRLGSRRRLYHKNFPDSPQVVAMAPSQNLGNSIL